MARHKSTTRMVAVCGSIAARRDGAGVVHVCSERSRRTSTYLVGTATTVGPYGILSSNARGRRAGGGGHALVASRRPPRASGWPLSLTARYGRARWPPRPRNGRARRPGGSPRHWRLVRTWRWSMPVSFSVQVVLMHPWSDISSGAFGSRGGAVRPAEAEQVAQVHLDAVVRLGSPDETTVTSTWSASTWPGSPPRRGPTIGQRLVDLPEEESTCR